jgi:hypothetical protein
MQRKRRTTPHTSLKYHWLIFELILLAGLIIEGIKFLIFEIKR